MRVLLLLVAFSLPAWAVVPALLGPLAALLEFVPQLLALLLGTLGFPRIRDWVRRHPRTLLVLALLAAGLLWLGAEHRKGVIATPTPRPLNETWVSFRGTLDGGGPGRLGDEPVPEMLGTVWRHSEPDAGVYLSSPVAVNERLYVGGSLLTTTRLSGSLECLNAKDGALVWRSLTRHPVFGSPVVAGGRVYCGEGLHEHQDCRLACLDAESGKELWSFATRGHVESSPTLSGDEVLFSAGGDGFYSVKAATGQVVWHTLCGHCDSSAAVQGERVYLGTAYGDDAAVCLDRQTGKVLWKTAQDLPVWGHPAAAGDRLFVGLGNGTFGGSSSRPRGAIVCLEAATGRPRWRTDLPDSVNTSLCLSDGQLLCGSRDGNVYSLNQADGKVAWKAPCGKPVLASLVLDKNGVLAAGGDGKLHFLKDGREQWSYLAAEVPCESSPMLNAGRLYLGCGTVLQCLGR